MTCRPASSRTKRQCSPFALMIYRAIVSAALNQKRCEPANKTPDHFISSNQLIGFPATPANYFLAVRCTREEKSPRMNSFSRLQSAPRCLNLNKINFFCMYHCERSTWRRGARLLLRDCRCFSSLSSGRFLNHVLQGHIERYVYIYTLSGTQRQQKQSSFSLSFLFEMGVSNKCWLASY
jgi:hypothetical protein